MNPDNTIEIALEECQKKLAQKEGELAELRLVMGVEEAVKFIEVHQASEGEDGRKTLIFYDLMKKNLAALMNDLRMARDRAFRLESENRKLRSMGMEDVTRILDEKADLDEKLKKKEDVQAEYNRHLAWCQREMNLAQGKVVRGDGGPVESGYIEECQRALLEVLRIAKEESFAGRAATSLGNAVRHYEKLLEKKE